MKIVPVASVFLALCTFSLLAGCKHATQDDSSPQREIVTADLYCPANVVADDSVEDAGLCVEVQDSAHWPDSIVCEVRRPDGTMAVPFALYDDGGHIQRPGHQFASFSSSDTTENDGKFFRRISGYRLANGTLGMYDFHFVFYGGGDVDFQGGNGNHIYVRVRNSMTCEITEVPTDSVLEECFEPRVLTVHVRRLGDDTVTSVVLRAPYGNLRLGNACGPLYFVPVSGDSVWQGTLTPSFFRRAPDLGYGALASALVYKAYASFGESHEVYVPIASFVNHHATLMNAVVPDTAYVRLSPPDSQRIPVQITLSDCELQSDSAFGMGSEPYGVKYDWRFGSIGWEHSGWDFMWDNGTAPDATAGDGVFSSWFRVPWAGDSALLNTVYYLRFYVLDYGVFPDTSEFVYDSVRTIRLPEGVN